MNRISDRILIGLTWLSGIGMCLVVTGLLLFLIFNGIRQITPALFFGDTPWLKAITGQSPVFDGIWPAVTGTVLLAFLSSAIAVPVGVASGIYLAAYASSRQRAFLGSMVDLLSGTPSIVMGLFGFTMILFLRKTINPTAQTGLFLAAVCIALLILPYLIRTSQAAIAGISTHLRLIGPAAGFSKWQNIRHVLLPLASRGILSGIILAVGRASEDTAVILLTGVVAQTGIPRNIWDKFEALPFRIYYLAAEHRNATELEQGFAVALVLLFLTGLLFAIAFLLNRYAENRWQIRRYP
ncbi:MAG: PstA family ABC transporter permease [Desulfatirhabdiaceae bacterium]